MRFTIILPTRNRCSFLPHAVRSALGQDFGDFELLASNNASDDDTASVIGSFDDPRLRVLRTDRPLSMVDHWNFVLEQARGDWVLFLCDDDAITPDCLSVLARLSEEHPGVPVIRYAQETYYYDDGIDAMGNALKYRAPRPTATTVVDARADLRRVYATMSGHFPKFLNSAVRRDVAKAIRERHGRVFHPWAPDYSAGLLVLSHVDRYLVTETPLLIWGKNRASYGSGSAVDPAHLLRFFREFPEFEGRLPGSPYPDLITVQNAVYDTMVRVRALLDEALREELVINEWIFRRQLVEDARRYVDHGHDAYRAPLAQLRRELRGMPVASRLELFGRKMERRFRRWGAALRGGQPRTHRLRGEDRFGNIAEASEYYLRQLVK